MIEKQLKGNGYITRGWYNWGWICPLTGDIHLAFDRPVPAIETAGAPAAPATVPAAPEDVFARCVFAQMFTAPPAPVFRRQPVTGPLSFASTPLTSAASPHARSTRPFRTAHPIPSESGQNVCRRTPPVRLLFHTNLSRPRRSRSTDSRRCELRLPATTSADSLMVLNYRHRSLAAAHATINPSLLLSVLPRAEAVRQAESRMDDGVRKELTAAGCIANSHTSSRVLGGV